MGSEECGDFGPHFYRVLFFSRWKLAPFAIVLHAMLPTNRSPGTDTAVRVARCTFLPPLLLLLVHLPTPVASFGPGHGYTVRVVSYPSQPVLSYTAGTSDFAFAYNPRCIRDTGARVCACVRARVLVWVRDCRCCGAGGTRALVAS